MTDQIISFALGLPHTPWNPVRVKSFARLREQLGLDARWPDYIDTRTFDERASNREWPLKMWRWGIGHGASHFLSLQDDTIVSPDFWPALRAMVTARPNDVIGLSAVHPVGPEIARQGHRWYRTPSWIIGWGYVIPTSLLREFVSWAEARPELVAATNEDDLIGKWIIHTGRHVHHPVPTIVDHDTTIESTYANDEHIHRRASVTWRGYAAADLASPEWWTGNPGGGPLLPNPTQKQCWACSSQDPIVKFPNGLLLCFGCAATVSVMMHKRVLR